MFRHDAFSPATGAGVVVLTCSVLAVEGPTSSSLVTDTLPGGARR
jgi:hypothetical protein